MHANPDHLATVRPPVDADPQETAEWVESLEAILKHQGPERAQQSRHPHAGRRGQTAAAAPHARPA